MNTNLMGHMLLGCGLTMLFFEGVAARETLYAGALSLLTNIDFYIGIILFIGFTTITYALSNKEWSDNE